MRENWLVDVYQNVKKAHAERLSQVVSLLQKKAASDPEVAEILHLLQLSMPHKGQRNDPHGITEYDMGSDTQWSCRSTCHHEQKRFSVAPQKQS